MPTQNRFGLVNLLFVTLTAGFVSGCSSNFAPSPVEPEQIPIGHIQGRVQGGNLPVTGASIYLYQASTSGYGTAATSLICNAVLDTKPCVVGTYGPFKDSRGNYYVQTDQYGNFALSGDYVCTQNSQVYMVATGGNPGLGGSVNNTAIVQMAGLGNCPSAGNMAAQVPYLDIDEVTTAAFAYAMGGFATTPYNVSADATGATGLANAMQNFLNIVNLPYGVMWGTAQGNSNSTAPTQKMNTLANILATCVNQTSGTSTPCQNLFKYATTSAGVVATDEGSAIFNIVHNQALMNTASAQTQAQNILSLYNLQGANTPFSPYLGGTPTDWTMPVIYKNVISPPITTGGTSPTITSGPYNLVFDANGDAWIGDRINGVVEIGPQGAVTTFSNASKGFTMVKGVAVSPQDGTIWVSDFGQNKIDIMNTTGTILSTVTAHMTATASGPVSTVFALNSIPGGDYMGYEVNETVAGIVAIDAGSYASTHYAGNSNSPADFTGVTSPGRIYVDSTGVVWLPSTNSDYAGELTVVDKDGATKYNPTVPFFGAAYTTVPEQLGMAADGLGNVWAAATISGVGTGLYKLGNGTPTGSYAGGGLSTPYKTFIDGNDWVWVANGGSNTVSGFNSTAATWLSTVGFSTNAAGGTGCVVIGVDPSGNVWTGNSDNTVTQLLGLATPTAAPLAGGRTVTTTTPASTVTTNGNLGTKP